jgi:hypothetical protein
VGWGSSVTHVAAYAQESLHAVTTTTAAANNGKARGRNKQKEESKKRIIFVVSCRGCGETSRKPPMAAHLFTIVQVTSFTACFCSSTAHMFVYGRSSHAARR